MVPLSIINPYFLKGDHCFLIFDILGYGFFVQRFSYKIDRFDHRAVNWFLFDVVYIRTINFNIIDRQHMDISKRRKPGPEVIQGKNTANKLEPLDPTLGAEYISYQGSLRYIYLPKQSPSLP